MPKRKTTLCSNFYTTIGAWEEIGIMEYPNPSKLFSLMKIPGYEKALTHRNAGLKRTVVIISKKD